MKALFFVICFLAFSACTENKDLALIRINKESILHGNSSKVWVISKLIDKTTNVSRPKLHQKDVAIFFKSGTVYFQPIASLGNFPERGGSLVLSEDSKSLFLDFKDEKWYFEVREISAERIVLMHKKESDFKYDLVLISYPEENKAALSKTKH